MKKLRKVLSLVLALTLVFSLLAVSASAYKDDSEIKNTEAAAVLDALKVIQGYDDGTFGPTKVLTRAEGAALMARLLLGVETADALETASSPFTDVKKDHWAAGYVAYCVQNNIIVGYGDGTFGPNDKLTVGQLVKMLLVALGYDATTEGIYGDQWLTATQTLAESIGLNAGTGAKYGAQCTRDTAAQLSLNTIQATMVKYPNNGMNITIGDTTIAQGKGEATKVAGANDNIAADTFLQFGEKYFPTLKIAAAAANPFGRPNAKSWYIGNDEICAADAVPTAGKFTGVVTNGEIYNAIGKDAFDVIKATPSTKVEIIKDGKTQTALADTDGDTDGIADALVPFIEKDGKTPVAGAGSTTEVYVTKTSGVVSKVTIIVINTYVAKATGNYNATAKTLALNVLNYDGAGNDLSDTVSGEKFAVADAKIGNFFLVTIDSDAASGARVQTVAAPKTVTGTISGWTTAAVGSTITVDNTKYSYSATIDSGTGGNFEPNYTFGAKIVLLLDTQGNVIGYTATEQPAPTYLYITAKANDGILGSSKAVATAYFTDGSTKTITVSKLAGTPINTAETITENAWYTYVEVDGTYAITAVAAGDISATATKITSGVPACMTSGIAATNSTVFIIKTEAGVKVYTGYKAVPNVGTVEAGKIKAIKSANAAYASFVFVDTTAANVNDPSVQSKDAIYLLSTSYTTTTESATLSYKTYQAVVNGEVGTVKVLATDSPFGDGVGLYTTIAYDATGTYVVTSGSKVANDATNIGKAYSNKAVAAVDGVLQIDSDMFVVNDSTKIHIIDLTKTPAEVQNVDAAGLVTFVGAGNLTAQTFTYKDLTGTVVDMYVVVS